MNIRTPEQCVPEKPLPYPWETCMTTADGKLRLDDSPVYAVCERK